MTHDRASDLAILGSAFVGLVVDRVAGSAISVATTIPHDAIAPLTTAVVALTLKIVDHVIKTREARAAAEHAERVARASAPPGPPRVVVAEDEESGQLVVDHAAEVIGAAVVHARNAKDTFLALARDRGVRLVVLDLCIPGAGPPTVFARDVRAAAPPDAQILIVSGREEAARVAETIGAAVLLKPVSIDTLADAMRAALPSR